MLGDGGLDSKFSKLSEKFYNKNTGLEACSKVVFDDASGLDALHKDIETLKASIDLSRDGNGELASQKAANSCECEGHVEQISNLELQVT